MDNFWRGSLILICQDRYILLGVDANYKTYIDLGGHREESDENIVETALREFKEETLGVFPNIPLDDIQELKKETGEYILFSYVDSRFGQKKYLDKFQVKLEKEKKPEIIDLVWIPIKDFYKLNPDDFYALTWDSINFFLQNK